MVVLLIYLAPVHFLDSEIVPFVQLRKELIEYLQYNTLRGQIKMTLSLIKINNVKESIEERFTIIQTRGHLWFRS